MTLYYVVLIFIYHFLVFKYLHNTLNRQLLGFWDTVAITAVLVTYLAFCAIPPFLWSRSSYYHPLWRGIESFICYALVALVLGAIFAAAEEGDWSVWSGIVAGGDAWLRLGSLVVLFMVFILSSWWGGKTASSHQRRRKNRKGRKEVATP